MHVAPPVLELAVVPLDVVEPVLLAELLALLELELELVLEAVPVPVLDVAPPAPPVPLSPQPEEPMKQTTTIPDARSWLRIVSGLS
jgi:hypothetical protein